MIFASTPESGESPCKGILRGEVDGKRICLYLNREWICEDCKENGIDECHHKTGQRPIFQKPEIMQVLKAAYGKDNVSYKKEIQGTQGESAHTFIPKRHMQTLRAAEWHKTRVSPRFLFVSCDPSGSTLAEKTGDRSDYVLLTGYVEGGTCVVIFFIYVYMYMYFMYVWFIIVIGSHQIGGASIIVVVLTDVVVVTLVSRSRQHIMVVVLVAEDVVGVVCRTRQQIVLSLCRQQLAPDLVWIES